MNLEQWQAWADAAKAQGQIMLAEYGEDVPRARLTVHATAYSARVRSDVMLVHSTAGFEPAGSVIRWTGEFWAVWFYVNGARQGRRYRTEDEARAHYNSLCGPAPKP